ncbi:MAG: TrkA family potassium uptake protein [Desulfuromonadaceae bacterium]|nr:TrkA family potassium uptake protein [Desulfuromonadaceae bacterium]
MNPEQDGPASLLDAVRLNDPVAPVVIVGCGRLGAMLASRLSRGERRVVVVDRNQAAFAQLDADFSGFRVTGDATELEVLREAGLEQAAYLLVTTEKDTLNLMVAQVGRTVFSVPQVMARVYDPQRESLYRAFDIETISPTSLTALAFLQRTPAPGGY